MNLYYLDINALTKFEIKLFYCNEKPMQDASNHIFVSCLNYLAWFWTPFNIKRMFCFCCIWITSENICNVLHFLGFNIIVAKSLNYIYRSYFTGITPVVPNSYPGFKSSIIPTQWAMWFCKKNRGQRTWITNNRLTRS